MLLSSAFGRFVTVESERSLLDTAGHTALRAAVQSTTAYLRSAIPALLKSVEHGLHCVFVVDQTGRGRFRHPIPETYEH